MNQTIGQVFPNGAVVTGIKDGGYNPIRRRHLYTVTMKCACGNEFSRPGKSLDGTIKAGLSPWCNSCIGKVRAKTRYSEENKAAKVARALHALEVRKQL